jgi:hypothetical protein
LKKNKIFFHDKKGDGYHRHPELSFDGALIPQELHNRLFQQRLSIRKVGDNLKWVESISLEGSAFFLVSFLLLFRPSQGPNIDFTHRIIGSTVRQGSQFNGLEPV